MHQSILLSGTEMAAARCTTCCKLFHCPLCPGFKPTKLNRIQSHLMVHIKNGISFEDKTICKCSLGCRISPHFHCPVCHNTVLRKNDMVGHLMACRGIVSPSTKIMAFKVQQGPSTALSSMHRKTDGSPVFSSPPVQQTSGISSVAAAAQEEYQLQKKKKVCPNCGILLYKNNLAKHIQRKHENKSKYITIEHNLKSVIVDLTNGISAVQKSRHGFSIPVHVQNKTWGHVHKVQCELEECRQYHRLAVRSGQINRQCEHIRSLQYCTETAKEEMLQESVLDEMVQLQFFGEANKATCLEMQKSAHVNEIPLCVPVAFEETSTKLCFSVYEPGLTPYTRLGRIIVTYNTSHNTWHCRCAKVRLSCIHKNISKWHLFQTNRGLFKTLTGTSTTSKYK